MSNVDTDKLATILDEGRKKQLRAGGRLLASDKSAFTMSYAGLNTRLKPGLGLPGAGWFDRHRSKQREADRLQT